MAGTDPGRGAWTPTLWQQVAAVFAALLVATSAASAWLQWRAGDRHEEEVVQRLSHGLAAHIASHTALLGPAGLEAAAVKELFGMAMVVNPSVEVYLLAPDGRVLAHLAPEGHLLRQQVDLAPIRRFIEGGRLPIEGDDPRSARARKVFSAAPLGSAAHPDGYVYVILLGEERDALAAQVGSVDAPRTMLLVTAVVALLVLLAGLFAFARITRPLRALTAEVRRFEAGGFDPERLPPADRPGGAEISQLRHAFVQMGTRIAEQWRALVQQDRQRRELVANISHDLRTPLTSLHGYLETLAVKGQALDDADRRRYLDTALAQSRKVGRLAQQLFELARLEHGVVQPEAERFSLAELTQDVFQKFELAAEARQLQLEADFAPDLPAVVADVALIERVLTNLLDNAIQATPAGGRIRVRLHADAGGRVAVQVSDTGPGIPPPLRAGLFTRPSAIGPARRGEDRGGLGLLIVRSILRLHGSDIELVDQPGTGTMFRFDLATG